MARRASACGHVDNARALPTCPQAQKKQQINLVVSERKCSGPARHIQTTVRPGSHDAPPLSLRHLCADSHSHPQATTEPTNQRFNGFMDDLKEPLILPGPLPCIESSQLVGLGRTTMYRPAVIEIANSASSPDQLEEQLLQLTFPVQSVGHDCESDTEPTDHGFNWLHAWLT